MGHNLLSVLALNFIVSDFIETLLNCRFLVLEVKPRVTILWGGEAQVFYHVAFYNLTLLLHAI